MTTLDVRNPRNGKVDYSIPCQGLEDITAIATELRSHQQQWARADLDYRIDVLQQWRSELVEHRAELTHTLSTDTGRYTLAKAEVEGIFRRIDYWCEQAPQILNDNAQGTSTLAPTVNFVQQPVPYGLVGIISPWNFPLTLALIDAIPALLAGCAVILKPSEVTPRFAEPLNAAIQKVPELARVFAVVCGDASTGIALISQSDTICFTGSVATGRKVGVQAAEQFIPAFLELGGKDPAVVMPSADLDNAATAIVRSAIVASGQACQSLERIYVHEQVTDPFIRLLVEKTQALRLNYPNIHDGHVGPLIFQPQAKTIQAQLDDAVAKGAKVLCGGHIENLDGGLWCQPTVITDVTHDMKLMTDETFGPIIPVMSFSTTEQAIELANDSEFGLSAAVFAEDGDEAESIAKQLDAGAVSINDASLTAFVHDVEKNSFKHSGLGGSRMGRSGLLRFFRNKALLKQTVPAMPLEALAETPAESHTSPDI